MITAAQINKFTVAFTEWDRRYREEPDRFDSDMKRMLRGQTVSEYGESAAVYFGGLLDELAKEAKQ